MKLQEKNNTVIKKQKQAYREKWECIDETTLLYRFAGINIYRQVNPEEIFILDKYSGKPVDFIQSKEWDNEIWIESGIDIERYTENEIKKVCEENELEYDLMKLKEDVDLILAVGKAVFIKESINKVEMEKIPLDEEETSLTSIGGQTDQ